MKTTTKRLIAGLIAAVVVCAIPASILTWVGIVVGIATAIVIALAMHGDIKLPGSVQRWLITLPSLVGASIALAFAAQLVQYIAAISFWVILGVFVCRGVSNLRKKLPPPHASTEAQAPQQ